GRVRRAGGGIRGLTHRSRLDAVGELSPGSRPAAGCQSAVRTTSGASLVPVRRGSVRPGRLEDPGEVHLDDAVPGRLGELPAADLRQHALLGLGVVQRGLRDLAVRHRSCAIDGEEHRHLSGQRRVPVQLDLVAVLDLALVLLDDAGDDLARQATHHGGLARDDADRILLSPAEVDPAIAARALPHPRTPPAPPPPPPPPPPLAAPPPACPAPPRAGAPPADGLVHPGAGASRAEHVRHGLALQRPEEPAPERPGPGRLAGARIDGRASLLRRLRLLLGGVVLSHLPRDLGRGLALLGPRDLLLLPALPTPAS